MERGRAIQAECRCVAYIYRDSTVASMGHDLELEFPDCLVELNEGTVAARVRTHSVRFVGVVEAGVVDPNRLSDFDRRAVDRDTKGKVLESDRYPEASFRSTAVVRRGSGWRVEGLLDLHGTVRTVGFDAVRRDGRVVASFRLQQPDFNITPFRAAMGLLRLKPEVDVQVSVPLDAVHAATGRS